MNTLTVKIPIELTEAVDLLAARTGSRRGLGKSALWNLAYPLALVAALSVLPLQSLPLLLKVAVVLAIVVPMGPMIYRVAFQPVAEAPVLILLIVSVALHLVMVGLGLLVFGPEGSRTAPFSEAQIALGSLTLGGHTLVVLLTSLALIVGLYLYFDRTLVGKALRATALNRNGARLMGISPALAGRQTFLVTAVIGALSGLFAAIGALVLGGLVSRQVFQLELAYNAWLPVAAAIGGALMTMAIGWLGVRRLLATPPLLALRNGA